jgi:hypothetical protein
MRNRRAMVVAPCLLLSGLSLRCGGDPENPTAAEQCQRYIDELCGRLTSCQPASDQRDYNDVCHFRQSVYGACVAVFGKQFDVCIQSIRDAPCPAPGEPIQVSDACGSMLNRK